MNQWGLLTALGCGITAFLVAVVGVIESLAFEFSAIVALPVAMVAGIAVTVAIAAGYDEAGTLLRHVLDGVAGFGYAVVTLLGVRYVDLAGLRSEVTFGRLLGAALVVALSVFVLSWRHDRRSRT